MTKQQKPQKHTSLQVVLPKSMSCINKTMNNYIIKIYPLIKKNWKALLCYNICWSILASQFLPNICMIPDLYAEIPAFMPISFFSDSTVMVTYLGGSQYSVYGLYPMKERTQYAENGRGWGHVGGNFFYVSVCAKLFWRKIYCTNPSFDTKSLSGSWSRRGLVSWDTQIMQ